MVLQYRSDGGPSDRWLTNNGVLKPVVMFNRFALSIKRWIIMPRGCQLQIELIYCRLVIQL